MNRRDDEFGEILQAISEATRFHKQYLGLVLDIQDEYSRGRVKVSIPELGWVKVNESPWVEPEYPGMGVLVPEKDSWVVVFFLAGDIARPVYRGYVGGIKGSTPPEYDDTSKRLLFQDGDVVIYYDGEELVVKGAKNVRIEGEKVAINGNDKYFVTYDALDDALQPFVTALKAHTHPGVQPGGGVTSPSVTIPSLDISGAKSSNVVTGG